MKYKTYKIITMGHTRVMVNFTRDQSSQYSTVIGQHYTNYNNINRFAFENYYHQTMAVFSWGTTSHSPITSLA